MPSDDKPWPENLFTKAPPGRNRGCHARLRLLQSGLERCCVEVEDLRSEARRHDPPTAWILSSNAPSNTAHNNE